MTMLHLVGEAEWTAAKDQPTYAAESLETEGFIHCCTPEQLLGVIDRYYSDRTDLHILVLDADAVGSEIRWEESPPNGTFPHIYGTIATAAVVNVVPMPPADDGTFALPSAIAALD